MYRSYLWIDGCVLLCRCGLDTLFGCIVESSWKLSCKVPLLVVPLKIMEASIEVYGSIYKLLWKSELHRLKLLVLTSCLAA